ncbi:MAG: hypothetical protein H7Z18_09175 [Methylophilaceae bacterium]|nr:hypothetical protein [Methylophilaceae bacterium]
MQIIPVIDLMGGQVVHAKHGLREQYQPIKSQLTPLSEPLAIVEALLKLYPFDTLYIADIDAILSIGSHIEVIESISENYPQLNLWLDSGIQQANARALYMGKQIKAIVGSENIESLQDYRAISYACNSQHILSIDFNHAGEMGIPELHKTAHFWPDEVICMTLSKVGSGQGFDIERLKQLQSMNSLRKKPSVMFAAGGLRDVNDVKNLAELNIKGMLVATALHQKKITSNDIKLLAQL